MRGHRLAAPELSDLKVLSVLRALVRSGQVLPRRAELAVDDLVRISLDRAAHRPLVPRCWQARNNLTPYGAAYVALAELLDAPLVTADRRLTEATGPRCTVEVLSPRKV